MYPTATRCASALALLATAIGLSSIHAAAQQPVISLGEAANYALVGRYIQLHNADVYGDAAIGAEAGHYNLDLQSPGILHGTAYREPGATITGTPANVLGGIVTDAAAVGQAFADAMAAYDAALMLTPDVTLANVNGVTVNASHGGQFVVRVTGNISGSLVLNPFPGSATSFVVVLDGTITLGGSDTVGWADAAGAGNVLIVVRGTGNQMTSHINNRVYGTMLAPYRGATFHGFAGALISGSQYVKLMSDAQINFVPYSPCVLDVAGVAPTSLLTVTAECFEVSGAGFQEVTSVSFGGTVLGPHVPGVFGPGSYEIVTGELLRVCPPQCLPGGVYTITVTTACGSDSIDVTLVEPTQPTLACEPQHPAGVTECFYFHGGGPGPQFLFIAVSPVPEPSVIPGLLALGIGAQFTNYYLEVFVGECIQWCVPIPSTSATRCYYLQGFVWHSSNASLSQPLPTSDVCMTCFY